MLNKTIHIMEYSRIFSLPMTILSWLVIFTFCYFNSGNILYGIIALIGLCFAHLGTNLIDDYFDYKFLIKQVDFDKQEYLKHSQKTKCRYLINGMLKESQVLLISLFYFSIALLCGIFLFLKCGIFVLYFALIGAFIVLTYPLLSRICLSEIAVAIAYGPALFGGVYYVMLGSLSKEVFILSIPTMLMTVILLYIHTVMDYPFDIEEGKMTIANRFNSQLNALIILKILLILTYSSLLFLCIFDILDWQIFITLLTIPLGIDLYKSLIEYACNNNHLPNKKWYHFPLENFKNFEKKGEGPFMFRMLQTRNLMIYFSLLLTISIIIGLGI